MASKNDKLVESTFEKVKPRIDAAIQHLQSCDDYQTTKAETALKRLVDFSFESFSTSVAVYITNLGYGKLFNRMYSFLTPADYLLSRAFNREAIINLLHMQTTYWNYTNVCPELCGQLGKHGGIHLLFQCMGDFDKALPDLNAKDWKMRCIEGILGILHNCIRLCGENRSIYRQANGVSILTKYLKSSQMVIRLKSLIVLSYIVDDRESGTLQTAEGCVAFLTGILKDAVQSEPHRATLGSSSFSAEELLRGLKNLSLNDSNKLEIVKQGGLSTIRRMLQPDFSEEEQSLAVQELWTLAFMESIRGNQQIQDSTNSLKKLSLSKNRSLRNASKYALWEIEGHQMQSKPKNSNDRDQERVSRQQSTSKKPSSTLSSTTQIMLSYQWDSQKLVVQIRDRLIAAGYTVWMDIDKMKGDILAAMAEAVEQSTVILICMTENYQRSESCRTEASYAFKKGKHMIPLQLQVDYEPDGWLGALIGMKLYYKFYSEKNIDANMPGVLGALAEYGVAKMDEVEGASAAPIVPQQAEILGSSQGAEDISSTLRNTIIGTPNIRDWSTQRVQQWLKDSGLSDLCSQLDFCDGDHLEQMNKQFQQSPQAFRSDLKSDLKLSYLSILKFTTALEKLFRK